MISAVNKEALMSHIRRGNFCDTGHYHCPRVGENGTIIFSAGIIYPDGGFSGAKRLLEHIQQKIAEPLPVFARGSFGHQPEECPADQITLVD